MAIQIRDQDDLSADSCNEIIGFRAREAPKSKDLRGVSDLPPASSTPGAGAAGGKGRGVSLSANAMPDMQLSVLSLRLV